MIKPSMFAGLFLCLCCLRLRLRNILRSAKHELHEPVGCKPLNTWKAFQHAFHPHFAPNRKPPKQNNPYDNNWQTNRNKRKRCQYRDRHTYNDQEKAKESQRLTQKRTHSNTHRCHRLHALHRRLCRLSIGFMIHYILICTFFASAPVTFRIHANTGV